jgi:hypothetical protein
MLSASGAARWLTCTPCAKLEYDATEKTSAYAEEGTTAHALCELKVNYNLGFISQSEYDKSLESIKESKYYNVEMEECAELYADFIFEKLSSTGADREIELEVKLDFSNWIKQGFGTADCVIISDNKLRIIDFKYGKGHHVKAENNPQMRIYAIGALERYKIPQCTVFLKAYHKAIF